MLRRPANLRIGEGHRLAEHRSKVFEVDAWKEHAEGVEVLFLLEEPTQQRDEVELRFAETGDLEVLALHVGRIGSLRLSRNALPGRFTASRGGDKTKGD